MDKSVYFILKFTAQLCSNYSPITMTTLSGGKLEFISKISAPCFAHLASYDTVSSILISLAL